jgi:O-antigen ligase
VSNPVQIAGKNEHIFFIALLVLMCSTPFILGDQPMTLVSASDSGILPDQGDSGKQAILALAYAICAVLLVKHWDAVRSSISIPVVLLTVWCFLSSLWADLPDLAMRRGIAMAGTVAVGLYAGARFNTQQLVNMLGHVARIVALISLIVAMIIPSAGFDPEGRLRGVFAHKNFLGSFMALGILSLTWSWQSEKNSAEKLLTVCSIAVCGFCLALTRSAAPVPALCLSLALMLWQTYAPRRKPLLTIAVLALVTAAGLTFPLLASGLGALADLVGRDSDFSGRTQAWLFSMEFFSRKAWLGYGYGTFWSGPAGMLFFRWAHFVVPHAHNGFLQLLLDTGVVGLALFTWALAGVVIRASRCIDTQQDAIAWVNAFLLFFVISNFAESLLWIRNELLTIIFVCICTQMLRVKAEVARSTFESNENASETQRKYS